MTTIIFKLHCCIVNIIKTIDYLIKNDFIIRVKKTNYLSACDVLVNYPKLNGVPVKVTQILLYNKNEYYISCFVPIIFDFLSLNYGKLQYFVIN